MILKNICLSNQSEQHPIRYLYLETRLLYNTIKYVNENTTDYLIRFRNSQKANKACNENLVTRIFQEHGMEIIYPLHVTGFDAISDNEKKEADTEVEEIIYAVLYLENSYKAMFDDLKKRGNKNYVLSNA